MHKIKILSIAFVIATAVLLLSYSVAKFFQEEEKPAFFTQEEIKQISENVAHLLVDTLHQYDHHYDLEIVFDTVRKIERKEEPLKSLETCQLALFDFKCKMIEEEMSQNLQAAEQFLANLAHKANVIEVQKGKLYYEILQKGEGSPVDRDSLAFLHFTETNLNQRVIRDTREDNQPLKIKLSETIAGFCRGVTGMQVGERRKIYVHPDLAYKKLSRQQLSIFDVEIISE